MITKIGSSVLCKLADDQAKYEANIQEILRRLKENVDNPDGLYAKKYKPLVFADVDKALAKEIRDAHGRSAPELDGYDGHLYVNNGSMHHWLTEHMRDDGNGKTKFNLAEAEKMLRSFAKARDNDKLRHFVMYNRNRHPALRESCVWDEHPDSRVNGKAPFGVFRTSGGKAFRLHSMYPKNLMDIHKQTTGIAVLPSPGEKYLDFS